MQTTIDDPLDEERWSLYARVGAAAGIASSLSMPIFRGGRRVGGVNLYASTADAFTGHHDDLALLMGTTAAEAVSNADLSFSTRLEAAAAPAQIRDRTAIDTAVGLLAALRHSDLDTAQRLLMEAAARAGITEALVARVLVLVHARRPDTADRSAVDRTSRAGLAGGPGRGWCASGAGRTRARSPTAPPASAAARRSCGRPTG